jgi:hypothetical protein
MKYSEAEYTCLRAELLHHDGSCLTILGLLLASSTAIYGLVADRGVFPLLIMLSIIWLIGFLYIVEKRATIRRISHYIKNQIEAASDSFNWETYSRQNRSATQVKNSNQGNDISLPTVSPLKIEFSLLILTNLINTIWLWSSNNFRMALFATLLSVFSIVWSGFIVTRYYASRQH